MRNSFLYSSFALLSLLAAGPAGAAGGTGPILPLAEVRAGMVGTGHTIFSGGRIEPFEVEVLGVLQNTAPRRSTILARLKGGPLAESGVIAGMSGSPVYVEGRLVGAVSSGYTFSKEPIAGITPIEEMLAIPTREYIPGGSKALYLSAPGETASRLLALEEGRIPSPLESFARRAPGSAPAGRALVPVVLSGLEPRALEVAAGAFRAYGLEPLSGIGVARDPAAGDPELRPGSAVAVELVRGDLNIAAYGTVTARRGDEVLAFGHPLFSAGTVRFPMAAAEVVTVLPSVMSSFKISTLGRTVGALEQDRATGVLGRIGGRAEMVPLALGIKRGSNPIDDFHFELATHRLLTPVLVQLALQNSLLATEKLVGASTLELSGRVEVEGHPPVVLEHFFSGDQAAPTAAQLVAAVTDLLLNNEFESASIAGITLTVGYLEDNRYALLDRVWTGETTVRPGQELEVKASLQHVRGGEEVLALRLRVPEGTPAGPLDLVVGDASSLARLEARSQRYAPRTLRQLIDLVNDLRKSSSVYALLSRPDSGVSVRGSRMVGLPPSAYSLLLGGDGAETLLPIRRATLAEADVPSGFQVSGLKTLRLTVDGARE